MAGFLLFFALFYCGGRLWYDIWDFEPKLALAIDLRQSCHQWFALALHN